MSTGKASWRLRLSSGSSWHSSQRSSFSAGDVDDAWADRCRDPRVAIRGARVPRTPDDLSRGSVLLAGFAPGWGGDVAPRGVLVSMLR